MGFLGQFSGGELACSFPGQKSWGEMIEKLPQVDSGGALTWGIFAAGNPGILPVVTFLLGGFLVGGFNFFVFSPLLGEMIQFDEHIFQMGLKPPTRFYS